MNLKRIIALVLLIALVMTVMPAFANEEVAAVSSFDAEAYKKNVDFITSLEIYSFSDEKPDSSVTRAEFAKMIAEEAYLAGAGYVDVQFQESEISKLHYQYASDKYLLDVPEWSIQKLHYWMDEKEALSAAYRSF